MATSAMYKMKPVYGSSDVVEEYPTCMYKMKNIHGDSAEDLVIDDSELLELKTRQEAVLKELEKLKHEVDQIGVDIGLNSQSESVKASSTQPSPAITEPISCNIVVKASPDDPPLSVNLLYRLAQQQGLDCSLKSHVHSSWPSQVPSELIELFDTSCDNSRLCLRFIWKSDILAPNLIVSVADQSPILGEANILRYLARMFQPHLYSNNDPLQISAIDDWLNSAIKLTSPKDMITFIQSLNTHLGKHNWLAGSSPSIADIYCSVAVLKHNNGSQLPKNVAKWLVQCRKDFPGFERVEKLCK